MKAVDWHRTAFITIDSISRRSAHPVWVVVAACALCLPLEGGPWAASSGQLPAPALSAAVVPDPSGYTVKNESEPGGPAFSFVDISTTGTRLTFFDEGSVPQANAVSDDAIAIDIPLGFTFNFYGTGFTTVNMSSNGFLHFDSNADSFLVANQCPMPDALGPNNLIAVLWDDLVVANAPSTARGGYTQQFASCPNTSGGAGACTIFMWDNAGHFFDDVGVDSFDFEAILYANGKILMQYGPGNPDAGASSTTGLENATGTAGRVYACDSAGSIPAGRAVLFSPPPPSVASAGRLLISELRLQGPAGASDEFVEIYNNSDAPLNVATADGSSGYALVASSSTAINDGVRVIEFIIPNGTIIPARGHYLAVNSAYSLASYPAGSGNTADGDVFFTDEIPNNAGIALFRTSHPVNFTLANRLDAVGSIAEASAIYREGAGYAVGTAGLDFSFTRRVAGGVYRIISGWELHQCVADPDDAWPASPQVQDTNDNAADFIFVSNNAGFIGSSHHRLGAPGPENLRSPIAADGFALTASKLDSCERRSETPNHVLDANSDPANNSTFGTIDVRRTFTNTTGMDISRLRFRIVDITTFPPIAGVADLRTRSSGDISVTVDRAPCGDDPFDVTVRGTTQETPADQPLGSGFNASLSVGAITPETPLAAGDSVNVHFLLGIEQTGAARFCVAAETLPASSSQILCFIGPTDGVMTPPRTLSDFNADGIADIALYRPSTSQWFIRNLGSVQLGQPGDIPVPGAYSGGGFQLPLVFRPSTGQWIVHGGNSLQWGAAATFRCRATTTATV